MVRRQAELTNDSDDLLVPSKPVIHLAVALLARERGETGGTSTAEYFAIADKYLSDAIAIDAAKHPEEMIFRLSNMAQELRSINLVAPAFKGINTEDSPLAQDPSFAEIADNAVIDKRGRIAARKGYDVITTTKTVLGTAAVRAIREFRDNAGNSKIFSVGNNKIISGTTTLVDETPASYTITADDWKMVDFNDNIYFFQRGYEPLVYSNSSGFL